MGGGMDDGGMSSGMGGYVLGGGMDHGGMSRGGSGLGPRMNDHVSNPAALPAMEDRQPIQTAGMTTLQLQNQQLERRTLGERSKQTVRFADDEQEAAVTANASVSTTAARTSSSAVTTFKSTKPESKFNPAEHLDNTCSACQHSDSKGQGSNKKCSHTFCVSCVKEYFHEGHPVCPVCGSDDSDARSQQERSTQPKDGVMLVTYDNAFRLPGYETSSRGTIVVSYSFPSGIQQDHQPHPGCKYSGLSKTAFLPLTVEGATAVELLQRAFSQGLVFAMVPSASGKDDEIGWNGILHKTNIYGGPAQSGYPDAIYLKRVMHELAAKGIQPQ
jgi:deltex-like protein